MATQKKVTRAQVEKWVRDAEREWLNELGSEEKVREVVFSMLNSRLETIVAGLAGFTRRWGIQWEIDSCNGRVSPAEKILVDEAKDALASWIKSMAGDLPKITGGIKKAIQSEYTRAFNEEAERWAEMAATKDAKEFVMEVLGVTSDEED